MGEKGLSYGTIFDPELSDVSRYIKQVYPKERALLRLNKLKVRAGFETHTEFPRPFKDVSSLKKDFDIALNATRRIQASRMDVLIKKQKTEQDSVVENCLKSTMLFDRKLSNRANIVNIVNAKRSEKYPLNNLLFKTLWNKIFIPKNEVLRTDVSHIELLQESIEIQKSRDNRVELEAKNDYLRYKSGSGVRPRIKQYKEKSFDYALNIPKEWNEPPGFLRRASHNRQILTREKDNSKTDIKCKEERPTFKNENPLGNILQEPAVKTQHKFKISTRRGNSVGGQEHPSHCLSLLNDPEMKYESSASRKFLLHLKHRNTKRLSEIPQ